MSRQPRFELFGPISLRARPCIWGIAGDLPSDFPQLRDLGRSWNPHGAEPPSPCSRPVGSRPSPWVALGQSEVRSTGHSHENGRPAFGLEWIGSPLFWKVDRRVSGATHSPEGGSRLSYSRIRRSKLGFGRYTCCHKRKWSRFEGAWVARDPRVGFLHKIRANCTDARPNSSLERRFRERNSERPSRRS